MMARTSKRLKKAYDGLDNVAAYPLEEASQALIDLKQDRIQGAALLTV